MLFLPIALLWQKRAELPGHGLGQVDARPQQRWGCNALPESRDRGAEQSLLGAAWAAATGTSPTSFPLGSSHLCE